MENAEILEEIRRLPRNTAVLNLEYREITSLVGAEFPDGLKVLDLRHTPLTNLNGVKLPSSLQQLCLSGSKLDSLEGLQLNEGLLDLDLSFTPITSYTSADLPENPQIYDIIKAMASTIDWLHFPSTLQSLDLSYTDISKIPDSISRLKNLRTLNLCGLELEEFSEWLFELGLPITQNNSSYGINLYETTIKGIDMSIFDQSQETIRDWLTEYTAKKWYDLVRGYSHAGIAPSDLKLDNILSHWSQKDSKRHYILFDEYAWEHRHAPKYLEPRFGFEPFDFGKYYYPIIYPEWFTPMTREEESPIRWVCGRYTPPGCFNNKDWKAKTYLPAWKAREPIYLDDVPEETPEEELTVEESAKPLNELKVVFLGDGEAGKSHTIARLLNDGIQVDKFRGVSTPGIVIEDKEYQVGSRQVKVHYWDFGGQEILHSMHRMFLTTRTLYVVMLNVREGNQDDRARYWLHNLRSFANGAPVLLVLNKMDMNRNASVNESDLRSLYPKLTQIVKLSTKEDSEEEFNRQFRDVLLEQIGKMDILDYSFIPAWRRLKDKLQNMTENYIKGGVFRDYCDECGVRGSDTIRRDLLNWFSDLGVSFCYSDKDKPEDYVVLRPDWITNAIYIILFNKIEAVTNGLVTHDTIYRMLSSGDSENIRRTVDSATYTREEVDYVLNVIRKFRLSFPVENERTEFMPMLCNANSTAAAEEYEKDPDALEFRMHYDYLPNNVIHRLMVDRRKELDRSNVWLTGARFACGDTGRSAVVKSEGNLIRILVRAEQEPRDPQRYLDELKESLERINEIMGLTVAKMEVVYKENGKTAHFDYADLLFSQEMGDVLISCRELRKKVRLTDVLMQSDFPEDEKQKKLMADIRQACEMLQEDSLYWKANEDQRTGLLAKLLRAKSYIAMEQHRTGISAGGI